MRYKISYLQKGFMPSEVIVEPSDPIPGLQSIRYMCSELMSSICLAGFPVVIQLAIEQLDQEKDKLDKIEIKE